MKKIILISLVVCLFVLSMSLVSCSDNSAKFNGNKTSVSSEVSQELGLTSILDKTSNGTASQNSEGIQNSTNSNNSTAITSQNSNNNQSSTTSTTTSIGQVVLSQADIDYLVKASNVIDWQLDNGGWGKNYDKTVKFNSYPNDYCWTYATNKFCGTIDNDATHVEMRMLAKAYEISKDAKYKASFDKAFGFIKNLQYSTGGFSQIYPHNGKYNDDVTLNDDAMIEVMFLLQDMANGTYPFANIIDNSTRTLCRTMVNKGVDYLLKAQITVNNVKTAWCAQHNPTTYAPTKARAYELPSISGCESVGVIKFLLTQTNNAEAIAAANAAKNWLIAHRMDNTTYSKSNPPSFFTTVQGKYCWYRFYSLTDGRGYFCTRGGKVYYTVSDFVAADKAETAKNPGSLDKDGDGYDRATGYDWAGEWLARAGLNI